MKRRRKKGRRVGKITRRIWRTWVKGSIRREGYEASFLMLFHVSYIAALFRKPSLQNKQAPSSFKSEGICASNTIEFILPMYFIR
jgi:hypothetical protein